MKIRCYIPARCDLTLSAYRGLINSVQLLLLDYNDACFRVDNMSCDINIDKCLVIFLLELPGIYQYQYQIGYAIVILASWR
jgi:hypothetical protein